MKHLSLLALLTAVVSIAYPQSTITLTVDMSNETVSVDGVHVAGNFQGWDPGATPMTDNGDGTYSYTFTWDMAGTLEFKFINGNSWGQEEYVPEACHTYEGMENRFVVANGTENVEFEACFGSCGPCGTTTVRFRVNMENESAIHPSGVHVAGSFQGWDPSSTEMVDPDGDMVYETIQSFVPDTSGLLLFKFINGNGWEWTNEFVDQACGDDSGNRLLELTSENMVLSANDAGEPYCFNSCENCEYPVEVTFTVDMTSVEGGVSPNGVHLAGNFQGWTPWATPMTDLGFGIWSTTIMMMPGTYEFKFINSNEWDGNEEQIVDPNCSSNLNRIATFDADNNEYSACFNLCPGEPCLPPPDPATVTFRVNANELDLSGESMYLMGDFTGWQGGAIPMTDADGDGIWEHSEFIGGDASIHYLFSVGDPGSSESQEHGIYTLFGQQTNFQEEGCGVSNGFGWYNRRHIRSGVDEVLDVVCFNSCDNCQSNCGGAGEVCMTDDFDDFPLYSAVALNGGPSWVTWLPGMEGTEQDAPIVDWNAHSPPHALLVDEAYGQMDVVKLLGLEGAYELNMYVYVSSGASGYYNVQESEVPGVGWAFEMLINSDGTMVLVVDGAVVGSAAYTSDSWTKVTHRMDTSTDMAWWLVNDAFVLEHAYDGAQIGGVNFFGAGDGVSLVQYYVDDIQIVQLDQVLSYEVFGCMDVGACNFDPNANNDDGSCDYGCLGCTDPAASNFDAEATLEDGSCVYFVASCEFLDAEEWLALPAGLYFDGLPTMYQGAGVDGSGVLSMPLSVVEPASGNAFSVYSWSNLAVSNVPPGLAFDGFPASLGGGTNACVPLTGIPLEVGVFEVEVTGDLEISLFGNPYFIGEFVVTAVLEILPNPNPISGCTYPGAVNHLAYATVDDGTCLYAGCTDPEATNYYPIFILDDGSCVYGGGPTTCPSDVDQDGSVGTSDLLLMLSNFGMPCTN